MVIKDNISQHNNDKNKHSNQEEEIERSAGVILFRVIDSKIEFLLIHYPPRYSFSKGHWGFVKGHIEQGEEELDAALRECKEEVNVAKHDLVLYPNFHCQISYNYREPNFKDKTKYFKLVNKRVTFFLAKVINNPIIKLSYEHDDFKWLPYSQAYATLTYKQEKDCLKKAYAYILAKS